METMKTFTLGNEIYEITDGYARENIKNLQNDIKKINDSTVGSAGQIIEIESVDSTGKPVSYKGTNRGCIGNARGSAENMHLTGNGEFDQIPLTIWTIKNNSIMSLSGGGIKCAVDGIVKIWGSVELNTINSDERAGVYIFKYNAKTKEEEELVGSYCHGQMLSNAQIVASVSAGDIVYLKARSNTERNDRLIFPKSKSTNLCVEYC